MTTHQQADKGSQAACGTHERTGPMNTPGNVAEPNRERVDHETLADQVQTLAASMDGVSATGRAFLSGAETALRATAEVMHVD